MDSVSWVGTETYRFKAHVMKIMRSAKANPSPRMIPYPNPWDKGAVKVTVSDDDIIIDQLMINLQQQC